MFEREKEEGRIEEMNKRIKKIARANFKEINLIIERGRKSREKESHLFMKKKREQESRGSDNKNVDYQLSSEIGAMFQRMEEK
ncbi:MAG: hypothetical protein WBC21_00075 [Minisyncoccales bacterium]